MPITLTNLSRRLKTFTLTHEAYCAAHGTCSCTIAAGRPPRRLPASLSLAAGAALAGLADAVGQLPEVARARAAGELRVTLDQPAVSALAPVPAATPSSVATGRRATRTRGEA